MPTKITAELLSKYFKQGHKHKAYAETVKAYTDLKIHIDGEYPSEIIDKARPSEPDHIKEYRKQIFAHVTMPTASKVITSLSKIRKSEDWNIKYDETAISKAIRPGESLYDYMDLNFPYMGSATNWTFNHLLKQYLADPNAVIVDMPIEMAIPDTDYFRPFPFIFNSDRVMEFVEDDYCIVKSTDKSEMKVGEAVLEGDIYYVATTTFVQKWEQNQTDQGFAMTAEVIHNFGKMPAFKTKGLSWKTLDKSFLYRSRIYAMVPFLNEAAREYSDLQAGVVQHLFLERWEFEGQKCKACSGVGKVKSAAGNMVKCPDKNCNGGTMIRSPFQTIVVRNPLPGQPMAPNPPAGYIDRNPEIIKLQDERVDRHQFKALAAVNMEFLAMTPLAQSGVAKMTDREETHNFAHGVAEDIVAILDKVYYFSNEWRNFKVVADKTKRLAMLPKIAVPEKFDLFTSAYLVEELQKAKEAKVNPALVKAMEVEYAAKKFNYDNDVKIEVSLVLNLDPIPGITQDEKASMLMNKGITEIDYIVSCNISQFVKRALTEDPKFAISTHADQVKKMQEYGAEIQKATSAAEKLKQSALDRQAADDEEDDTPPPAV